MQECQFDTSNLSLVFHLTVSSCRNDLDQVVGQIMQIVHTLPGACGTLDDVELALAGALANAIISFTETRTTRRRKSRSVALAKGWNVFFW